MSLTHNGLTPPSNTEDVDEVTTKAIRRATFWLDQKDPDVEPSEEKATEQLAELVRDPAGVQFTMDFVDRVARPEDNKVAARALRKLQEAPDFLGPLNKGMMNLGSLASIAVPDIVMPLARKRMRQMVGHLVLDAGSHALNQMLDNAEERGQQLNLNLLGEAVLGEAEAIDRTERTLELIKNPRVTYVSVKASNLCSQLNHWDYRGSLERLKDRLRPLYQEAKKRGVFINLDMEEYHDLHLTVDLFTELISEEEFTDLRAGIVLQAYLPDTYGALSHLTEFALERRDKGGAPIKVRLVKGANLSLEAVDGELHGWPQAPYMSKHEVDANYFRLLDFVLQPEYSDAIRIGVASHNLYTLALAWELAEKRGVEDQVDAEMLQGMSPAQSRAVQQVFGEMILYTPVVRPEDFDEAVSYLVRRLEENSESQNFLYSLFAPDNAGPGRLTPMQAQEARFQRAVNDRWEVFAGPRRQQDRQDDHGTQAPDHGRFVNEPDTDPALPSNREWGQEAVTRDPGPIEHEEITNPDDVDEAVARAVELGEKWRTHSGAERQKVLEHVGAAIADVRSDLIAVAAHEAGKTIAETDPEISEAIDFAVFYGDSAAALDSYTAKFVPRRVTLIVPPWNFPIAIPVGGITAALAAGTAVIIKPAPQVVRCGEVLVKAVRKGLENAGEDPDLVQLVRADEGEAGKHLISHDDVDQVILTGASETAALFRSWKPRLPLSAETSGKNAMIITPTADPDLAVADLYHSAFGHAGQKCSAASLAIFVGPAGSSDRMKNQLVDAVKTLKVGPGTDISTTMNGIIDPPGEKLERGLTQLDKGESWLLEPEQLDEEGHYWTPGIRDNVAPGSWYHTHECFGPVLGIMYADTLEEAVKWQNETGFGLTGGIQSLDDDEIAYWIDNVEVGNAYVNRGITGAIVQRQSFGGWKGSVVGAGAKAGGRNYVAQFGDWEDRVPTPTNGSISPKVARLLRNFLSHFELEDQQWLWRAAESDVKAWREEFSIEHDPTGLTAEANIFRYVPLKEPLKLRVNDGYKLRDVTRLLLGSVVSGVPLEITATREIAEELRAEGIGHVTVRTEEEYTRDIGRESGQRIRALGTIPESHYAAAAHSGSVILDQPVLVDGRRELLPFFREQAVAVTMHRFGIIREVGHIHR